MSHLQDAQKECLLVNAPLICRAASRVPFSVLKYAMTLDGEIDLPLLERNKSNIDVCICLVSFYPLFDVAGKIAASSGHASWISSKQSRNLVFELRGRSDAVIVGGNTVRRDSECHCSCLQISLNLNFMAYLLLNSIRSKTNSQTWRGTYANAHCDDPDS